jgi:K+-sensing histidine kinase KdpD
LVTETGIQHLDRTNGQDTPKQHTSNWKKYTIKNIPIILTVPICLVLLYFLSRYNYLLFHSAVEVFSIVIAFTIFAIAWNSRHIMDNNYLLFIGIAFLFIAGLDLIHTLAYKGMGVFPTFVGANLATQLWIATRYALSFSFLIPLLLFRRKIRPSVIFSGYFLVFAFLVISIFYLGIFPQAYVENVGLTAFKVASEYAISLILIVAVGLLVIKRKEFSNSVFKLLLSGMLTAIATELAFTVYSDVYGITNMVGHLLNVVSFYLIYRAIIETGLTKPYELLFRNLKQSESSLSNRATELTAVNSRLKEEIEVRKKVEEALKEREQLYHKVFDNSQDAFQLIELIYGADGNPSDHKFLRINHAYEEIIGVKEEDILNKTARSISPNLESSWLEVPDRVIKTQKSEHVELYNKDINKTLDCYYFPYAKKVVGTLFRDVSSRKNLERQLQDSERLAAIGTTAGMVGHDIRNPLQAITGDVFLVKTELASTPESEEKKNALDSMQEIEKNVDYINKIVADLQDFARPLNPHLEEADLKQIISGLLAKNGLPKKVKVSVKFETEKVVADCTFINRIMYNLVNNAVQAMPNGGKLTIHTYNEANDTVIGVKDSGIGIPEAVKGKLFTPMFTTKSKGQGFGLAVVKRMVEALGGTVSFQSQEGKGTTFTVRLPQKT